MAEKVLMILVMGYFDINEKSQMIISVAFEGKSLDHVRLIYMKETYIIVRHHERSWHCFWLCLGFREL